MLLSPWINAPLIAIFTATTVMHIDQVQREQIEVRREQLEAQNNELLQQLEALRTSGTPECPPPVGVDALEESIMRLQTDNSECQVRVAEMEKTEKASKKSIAKCKTERTELQSRVSELQKQSKADQERAQPVTIAPTKVSASKGAAAPAAPEPPRGHVHEVSAALQQATELISDVVGYVVLPVLPAQSRQHLDAARASISTRAGWCMEFLSRMTAALHEQFPAVYDAAESARKTSAQLLLRVHDAVAAAVSRFLEVYPQHRPLFESADPVLLAGTMWLFTVIALLNVYSSFLWTLGCVMCCCCCRRRRSADAGRAQKALAPEAGGGVAAQATPPAPRHTTGGGGGAAAQALAPKVGGGSAAQAAPPAQDPASPVAAAGSVRGPLSPKAAQTPSPKSGGGKKDRKKFGKV